MQDLLLLFVTVPVVTGLIGWVTNWAAVKMIFYPARFIGIGPLGWQGILYKQSHKFASGVAEMANNNLISAQEIIERLDSEDGETLLVEPLDEEAPALCKVAAEIIRPGAWDALPAHVQTMICTQIKQKTREINREILDQVRDKADDLVDVHALVYAQLSGANTDRLAEFTKRIGRKEFTFIEYYGGVFGFLIGLFQIAVWSVMQTWWLMPVVGVIVGLVTNWLAIQMIFRPLEPTRYLGFIPYQGLFPKRQREIAADYGQVSAAEILTARNLIHHVIESESGPRIAALVNETIARRMDEEWAKVRPMIPVEVTPEMLDRVKAVVTQQIMTSLPRLQPRLEAYIDDKLEVAQTVESRLSGLSKPAFERVLRGIFEEDEITLILVGGVLGGAVGVLQSMLVLAL